MTSEQRARRERTLIEYKWIVLITTTIGIFMASIDGSILVHLAEHEGLAVTVPAASAEHIIRLPAKSARV